MGSGRRGTAGDLAQGRAVPDPIILEIRYRPQQDDADDPMTESQARESGARADLAEDDQERG